MKVYLDGNALCITKDNFINLQESPAMFIELTDKQLKEFKSLEQQDNTTWVMKINNHIAKYGIFNDRK